MNEETLTELILENFEKQFPKMCPNCGKVYKSYADFIIHTHQENAPASYDVDFIYGRKQDAFIGVVKCHNCSCGDSMTIRSLESNPVKMLRIMVWVRKEFRKSEKSLKEMLVYYNQKVNELALKLSESD